MDGIIPSMPAPSMHGGSIMGFVKIPWDLRRRGLKDSMRHDKRVREAIKKNLKELIAEENIITSDGKKLVKIPLKYLDQYRFRHGSWPGGAGQGQGNIGDVIARDPEHGEGGEHAGDQPGEEVYEAEMSQEELTQMMIEDLGLPWLEEKDQHRNVVSNYYEFDDIRRKGSFSNLDKKRTLLENLKRHATHKDPRVREFSDDDLRFKVWSETTKPESNAAVYLLMDRSGSMTTEKKFIARSFFWWMVRFIRLKYQVVDIVFITHDTEAHIVSEQGFFTISNSGGTMCSSAFRLALEHIRQYHPKSHWNNYVFDFTDGDNWEEDNQKCKELVLQLLEVANMVGYGEIRYRDEAAFYGWVKNFNPAWSTLHKELSTIENKHFVPVAIKEKGDVYDALKKFLQPETIVVS
jgi:uncharacterized protein